MGAILEKKKKRRHKRIKMAHKSQTFTQNKVGEIWLIETSLIRLFIYEGSVGRFLWLLVIIRAADHYFRTEHH